MNLTGWYCECVSVCIVCACDSIGATFFFRFCNLSHAFDVATCNSIVKVQVHNTCFQSSRCMHAHTKNTGSCSFLQYIFSQADLCSHEASQTYFFSSQWCWLLFTFPLHFQSIAFRVRFPLSLHHIHMAYTHTHSSFIIRSVCISSIRRLLFLLPLFADACFPLFSSISFHLRHAYSHNEFAYWLIENDERKRVGERDITSYCSMVWNGGYGENSERSTRKWK